MIKILNSLYCPIIVVNLQNKILFINKFLLTLLDLEEEGIIGESLFNIISIKDYSFEDLVNLSHNESEFKFYMEGRDKEIHSLGGKIVEDDFKGENAYFIIGKKQSDKQYTKKDLEDLVYIAQTECCIKNTKEEYINVKHLNTICSYLSTNISNWKKCKEIMEERKKIEKINNSLMQFINMSEDMIGTWDLNGNSIYNNHQITNILGYKDIEKLNFFDILYSGDKTQIINMIINSNTDFGSVTSRFKCSDNQYKWIDWNYIVLKEENMFFFTGKDISDKISYEKKKLLEQQAKCIEEMKDEFLSNITHEFRTPINIIISTIQLINSSLKNNTYKLCDLQDHIKYLKSNSNRLLRLVNNLIDITYIKNGYHELNLKNYNIIELVENVCDTVVHTTQSNDIHIIFDTEYEEVIMACDADEIDRIIFNLLSNAIKYSFSKVPIMVSIKRDDTHVKISVKDSGVGIPKEYLDIVFEKLTRVDNKLARNKEGSGIGLAIVKSLVNLHKGNIEVESELGKGSNFIITLPINVIKENEQVYVESTIDFKNKIEKCAMEFSDIYEYN